MRSLGRAALVAGLLVACRPTPPATTTPELSPLGALTVPERVGAFAVAETTRFEPASAGVGYRFLGPDGVVADLYVYPIPSRMGLCVDACARDAVAAEVASFKSAIPLILERGYYDSLSIVRDTTVTLPDLPTDGPGRHLPMVMVKEGRRGVTHFYLFAARGSYLKVRVDFGPGQSTDAEIEAFVARLMAAIVRPGNPP